MYLVKYIYLNQMSSAEYFFRNFSEKTEKGKNGNTVSI